MPDENNIINALATQRQPREHPSPATLAEFEQAKAESSSEVLSAARLEQMVFRLQDQLKERNTQLNLARGTIHEVLGERRESNEIIERQVAIIRRRNEQLNTSRTWSARWKALARQRKQQLKEIGITLSHTVASNEEAYEALSEERDNLRKTLEWFRRELLQREGIIEEQIKTIDRLELRGSTWRVSAEVSNRLTLDQQHKIEKLEAEIKHLRKKLSQ